MSTIHQPDPANPAKTLCGQPRTAKREYKLAAYPMLNRDGKRTRDILEITEDGHRSVLLVVANDDAMDVRDALARAYQDGREDRGSEDEPIDAGTKVRLINPPGTRVPYGAVGIAEGPPRNGGLFWVQFDQCRMHTRVSEVEIVPGDDVDRFADDDLTDRVKP